MRLRLNGATVLDIGANKGIYCFWMMRAVGRSGRVIAFEPQPEMRDSIERRKLRFDWRNLRVMNVALSNSDGSMNLSRQKVGDGSASLELARRRSTDATLDVQVTRLDAMPEETFRNLKFIKCDVEGHELNVFLGGEQTLRRHRPVVVAGGGVAADPGQRRCRPIPFRGAPGLDLPDGDARGDPSAPDPGGRNRHLQ